MVGQQLVEAARSRADSVSMPSYHIEAAPAALCPGMTILTTTLHHLSGEENGIQRTTPLQLKGVILGLFSDFDVHRICATHLLSFPLDSLPARSMCKPPAAYPFPPSSTRSCMPCLPHGLECDI